MVPLERAIHAPWAALAVCGVLGGATYAALAWLFARDALRDLWALARPRLAV